MKTQLSKADILEALFFASDAPLSLEKISQILEISAREAAEELEILREEKARIGGLQVVEVSGGWQMLTKAEVAVYVAKLREAPRQKLSRAAFEVLAVVAYRQPATRAEVEELRGVDCSRPMTFLLEKKLIHFAGRRETPGRPWLYETTPQFLDHFGLRSIADLPPLAELEELNESALGDGASQLFDRAPMQTEDAFDMEGEVEAEAKGEFRGAADGETPVANEAGSADTVEDAGEPATETGAKVDTKAEADVEADLETVASAPHTPGKDDDAENDVAATQEN